MSQLGKQKSTLRLPPDRHKERKSQRYVDEMDDEDDLAGFIVDDDEVEKSEYEEDPVDTEQRALSNAADLNELPDETSKLLPKIFGGKYTSDAMMNVLHEITNRPPTARRDVSEAIEAFDQALQNPSAPNDMPQAQTLSDLFDKDIRIEDIETDSATLDRALHMISSAVRDRIRISAPDKHGFQSLLQTYENLFETYVNSLNPAVPDRFRVQRERQIRDIALDLYLSSRTVRALPTSNSVPTSDSEALALHLPLSDSDPTILSDPITQQDSPSRKMPAQISATASQPLPRHPDSAPSPSPSSPRPTPSPLDAAIARLKSYTTIACRAGPASAPTPVQTPTSISNDHNHTSTLLSHLPASAAADPTTYDWRATDLQTQLQLAASATATPAKNSKSKSKAERRVARTRRRAEGIDGDDVRTLIAGIGGGAQPRAGLGIGMGMGQIMSEGHVPESSQGGPGPGPAMTMTMASTQPVSGAFANRDGGKQKKKKRRVAGF